MRTLRLLLASAFALCCFTSCQTAEEKTAVGKPRLIMPGEEIDDKSWNRPTRSEDFASPLGAMPMSR